MRAMQWRRSSAQSEQTGFALVEVLLAVVVFGMIAAAVIGALVYGRASTADAGDTARAVELADEGIQAVENIRNASYTNLAAGTYGLTQASGQWAFSGTSDTTDIYTRQITITSAGTNRFTATATVSWPTASGGTNSINVATQLMNWAAAFQSKSWSNAIVAGGVAVTGSNNAIKTATSGNYAYTVLSATTNNFSVVDISNPASPTTVSTTTFSGTPTNIFVSGNYAYVTTSTASTGLEIINISNPAAPTLTKSVSFTGTAGANGVYVSGSYAYVVRTSSTTTGSNEFNVVNVSTPGSASVVGGYNPNVTMKEVYVSGSYAYVATTSTTQEMLVVKISTPTSPTLAATYNPSTTLTPTTITGYGNTVLLGMSTTLDAINVATPTSPTRLGTFTADGTIQDVDVDSVNQYAFLGTSSTTGEMQIVDISNPAAMALTKTVDVSGTSSTVGGVSYDSSLDEVAGASASHTQEVVVVTKN